MLGPGGEVGGGVAIPVDDELAGIAVKGPLRQLHPLLLGSTPRAGPTRGVPAVTNHEVCAEPSGFIPELTGKFRPCGVADGPSKAVVADEVVDGKVLETWWRKVRRASAMWACSRASRPAASTRLRDPYRVRDKARERRRSRRSRRLSGSLAGQRPTSVPSDPAATVPSGDTMNTRPAFSLFFHVLKALMRSYPDQGTFTDGSSRFLVSASVTNRRHWL